MPRRCRERSPRTGLREFDERGILGAAAGDGHQAVPRGLRTREAALRQRGPALRRPGGGPGAARRGQEAEGRLTGAVLGRCGAPEPAMPALLAASRRATSHVRGRLMVGGGARAAARALARYHVHTAPQVFIHVHQLKSPVKFRPNALHDAHRPPTSHQSHRPPAGRPVLWANGRWWQVGRGANLSAGHPSRPLKTAQAHISQK